MFFSSTLASKKSELKIKVALLYVAQLLEVLKLLPLQGARVYSVNNQGVALG